MQEPISILLVDDHTLFRTGLVSLLEDIPGIGKIYQASNGEDAIAIAANEPVDLVLMDIEMPGMDGFEATKAFHKKYPEVKILILSMRKDQSSILEISSYGANGYLFKSIEINELQLAIEKVMNGEEYFQKDISKVMVNGFKDNSNGVIPFLLKDAIKGKERKVLQLICDGLTADEIAKKINLSKRTVEGIKGKLYSKTGTNNERELISYALRNRVVN